MVGGCRGIFYKGVGKNLVQHKVDEKTLRYKLEAYKKKIPSLSAVVQEVQRY
jgi:hypothetical protein